MIAEQISDAKRSLKAAAGMAAWMAAAAIAIGFAVVMLAAAFFIHLAERYDALTASLVLAGCFAALAAIFVVVALYIRKRREQERRVAAAHRAAAAQSISWMEPAILAAGLDLARLIGGRRAASLAAGAVAAMWLLSKTGSASSNGRKPV
jgi:O-antigen/teichoic acid export membrane protein